MGTFNDRDELRSYNDKPAIDHVNGNKEWFKCNKRHRIGGFAIEYGGEYWLEGIKFTKEEFEKKVNELKMKTVKYGNRVETLNDKGELHSFNDKPAVEWNDGDKEWYKEGKLHRTDRPAVMFDKICESWFKKGFRHRLDGPAIKWVHGNEDYYIEDIRYTKKEFEKKVNELKMKTVKLDDRVETYNDKGELHSFNDKPAIEFNNGGKMWLKSGISHRLDGPASVGANGYEIWCKEGVTHRLDGPAIYSSGNKFWYKEGKRHRLDGPAEEYNNGNKEYYIEDIKYSKEEFEYKTSENKISQDFSSASYRVAANQFSKIVKKTIVSLLEKEGLENTKINNIKNVLDSEIGTVLVGMSIGYLLSIDKFKSNDKLTKLAKEFRIESTAAIGNAFIDNITKYTLLGITKETNCRISENESNDNDVEFVNLNNETNTLHI